MLQIISTNFGVSPASIQFKEYLADDLVVLNGQFSIDTTDADYQDVGILRITTAQLPFNHSHETSVFVINTKDGAHDITLTKAWIEKGNTICIQKLTEYESLGEYQLMFACAFIPANKVEPITYADHIVLNPSFDKGQLTNSDLQLFLHPRWAMLMFRAEAIVWDSLQNIVTATLASFPATDIAFMPIIYTNSISDTLGSKFYPASIHRRFLTIEKDGSADEASGAGYKFVKFFLVRDAVEAEYMDEN